MRIGQPARVIADVYGSQVDYHGHVIGLGAGTGAAFALLPAQNATGNWIKVVQRVPVRIALDAGELREHPLRVGLSIRATVDVHDQSGALVSTHNEASPDNQTSVYRQRRTRGRRAGGAHHRQQRRRARRGRHRRRRAPGRHASGAMTDAAENAPAPAGAPAPPRRAGAAARRRAGGRHDRAVAGHLHERARHVDRQRVDTGDRRRHRREPVAGHLGHHILRRVHRHHGAAHRLARAALRPGPRLPVRHRAFHAGVDAVRPCAQPADADRRFASCRAWWPVR